MPLPWLIGIAAVAVTAAVVKAVTDDDDTSPNAGEAERRRQEREAERQRKSKDLSDNLKTLKREQVKDANSFLDSAHATLDKLNQPKIELDAAKLKAALTKNSLKKTSPGKFAPVPMQVAALLFNETDFLQRLPKQHNLWEFYLGREPAAQPPQQIDSRYAKHLYSMLSTPNADKGLTPFERNSLLANIKAIEELCGPLEISTEEQQDADILQNVANRLEKLQALKSHLEQQE